MLRKPRLLLVPLLVVLAALLPASAAVGGASGGDFVKRVGPVLFSKGKPFHFAGTNNYYLMYQSQKMTNAVLDKAAAAGFDVVRTWAWMDIGNQDGSNSVWGADKGVYFHYWDGSQPAFNDGANGLQRLDYVVAAARARGLKLVLPLTNNWSDFGGIDQYVRWAGGSYHSDFYTSPTIRQWFKDWISHLLNRTNSITGIKYKDDPTIMTWELGNEPRCKGSGVYPPGPDCTTSTITGWAAEMSAYIKSIDRNHLVSSGSEGFLCEPNKPGAADDWTRNCGEGVDELAISKLRTIDVMSYHLYPDSWLKADQPSWSTDWIREHILLSHLAGKPSMLGEFGWKDKATRNPVYKSWTDTVLKYGGDGALYWILSDIQDDDTLYPDYDGYTVYCPSPVCTTLSNFGKSMHNPFLQFTYKPVADADSALVMQDSAGTALDVAANDIAYGPFNAVLPGTIDLDPATAGQQKTVSVTGGTFTLQPDNTVQFTPTPGFFGKVAASYTIQDRIHRTSNAADLLITVKMTPGTPITLFSFESGTDGWNASAGATLAQNTSWGSDGTSSLGITVPQGDWVASVDFPGNGLDLSSGYSQIQVDALNSSSNWGFIKMSIQAGSGWTWCETSGASLPPNANGVFTASLDLLNLSCTSPDLSQIHRLNLYLTTDTSIDNVRAN